MATAPSKIEIFGALAAAIADVESGTFPDAASAWRSSGAMALTGQAAQTLVAPDRVTHGLVALGAHIGAASRAAGTEVAIDGLAVVGERAALEGLSRHGDASCGRATRLLRAADGWIAIGLIRTEDREAVPAWLQEPGHTADWVEVSASVARRPLAALVDRGRLLGMPVAALGEVGADGGPAVRARQVGELPAGAPALAESTVVDLSSLWAGPLVAQILGLAGARVIKVESIDRPDGARRADPRFFDLLHGGHESVALAFGTAAGRAQLGALVQRADIVIEASRPRALRQLSIDRDRILSLGRVRTWLTLTGHGATEPQADWVGFGDDAAVAGGLVAYDAAGPCFCADAIADPASGLVAAAATLAAFASGRWHLDVALSRVAAVLASRDSGPWRPGPEGDEVPYPSARRPVGPAAPLGRDTDAVLRELVG